MTVDKQRALSIVALLSVFALWPGHARAQTEEFDQARDAYLSADYARTVELLRPLVGGAAPSISDSVLVRESRKYLGAALVLEGNTEAGERQFRWLLEEIAAASSGPQRITRLRSFSLNPRQFVQEVRTVFDRIRDRLVEETETRAERDRASEREAEEAERRAILALVQMAERVEVEVPNDEFPVWMPLGIGQFHNGNDELGWFFALSEGATGLAAFGLMVATNAAADLGFNAAAEVLFTLNLVSAGVFLVLAVLGIAEARVSWQPTRTVTRNREIPRELLDQLPLGAPAAGGLELRF